MVTAIIRPANLDDVIDALEVLGVCKLTATEVRGIGRAAADQAQVGDGLVINAAMGLQIDVAVSDEHLQQVLATVRAAALTGKPGDGKIFVTTLERALRIRNGTEGEQAL